MGEIKKRGEGMGRRGEGGGGGGGGGSGGYPRNGKDSAVAVDGATQILDRSRGRWAISGRTGGWIIMGAKDVSTLERARLSPPKPRARCESGGAEGVFASWS